MGLTDEQWNIISYGWFAVSLGGLFVWLWRCRAGRDAFKQAPMRTHRLGGLEVLVILLVFFIAEAVRGFFFNEASSDSQENANLPYLGLMAEYLVMTGVILFFAGRQSAGGWEKFGLSHRQLPRTAAMSIFYFVIVTGLTLLTLHITVQICEAVNIEPQKHATLQQLSEQPPLATTMLLIITAAIGAPIMEELLFRGILQSFLIRFSYWVATPVNPIEATEHKEPSEREVRPYRWLGIVIAGVFFMLTHADWQHLPALLVLGVCLGYIYERRGNLLMPIIVHSLFNIIPLTGTMLNSSNGG